MEDHQAEHSRFLITARQKQEMNDYIKQMQKHTRKQQLRDARRKTGVRKGPKKPRLKKISPNDWDDLDELEFETIQPILSRDESERRRKMEKNVSDGSNGNINGASDPAIQNPTREPSGQITGLVIEAGSGVCRVDINGVSILCDLRGNIKDAVTGYVNPIAVGDEVLISRNGTGRGVVETVLPRRSVLARPYSPDQGKVLDDLYQIVVANVDRLLIVASWREPYIWPTLIDRYLIAAQRNRIEAVICINKIDLIEDQAEFDATIQAYQDLDIQVLCTSVVTGEGIAKVKALLRDSTTVLAGLSGVGKSSILTAIQPDLNLKTGKVSERGLFTGQGRHTTTQSNLLKLENGGIVIDTPGVRTFGLAGIAPPELSRWYPEMVSHADRCQFGNCTHTSEPNCAVKTAVEDGLVSDLRYKNYTQILEELSA